MPRHEVFKGNEMGIIVKPLSFLICQIDRVEHAYPIIVGPAATAYQNCHSTCNIGGRGEIDFLDFGLGRVKTNAASFQAFSSVK